MEDHTIVGLVTLPLTLIGTLANWTVFILSFKSKTFVHSFGRLTAGQSLAEAFHSTAFLLCFVPMAFLNNKFMRENSNYLGHLLVCAYDISTYLHLCISANRFCALVFPVRYQYIFNIRFTYFLIAFSYLFGIVSSINLYGRDDCKVFVIDGAWFFVYSTTPICQLITYYAVLLKDVFIVILVATLDLITVINVHMATKKTSQRSSTRRNIEINFLKQACCQAVVFAYELLTYFIIAPRLPLEYKWLTFFFTTVAFELVFTMDGLITLYFNKEFHRVFRVMKNSNASGSHNTVFSVSGRHNIGNL